MINKNRLPFVFIAILSLILGIAAGLVRIGWNFSLLNVVPHHGAIMVGAFLGSLISLEKIIPLKVNYLYAIPVMSASSVLFFFLGMADLGFILLIAASIGLSVVFTLYLIRNRNMIYLIMLVGSLSWVVGNITLLMSNFYPQAFPWWMAFALCIISSERIELMKFLPVTKRNKRMFIFLLGGFFVGCAISFHGMGSIISGASVVGIAIWLMRYDVVSISITKSGITRYVAVTLFTGYFALLLTGIFILILDAEPYSYDIIVHIFFIGFVFSMIFAHGPIILPGVLGSATKPYGSALYGWIFLLHLSLIMRLLGDIFLQMDFRRHSGVLSALAIAGYFLTLVYLLAKPAYANGKVS